MKRLHEKSLKAFSLPELMGVLVIIGSDIQLGLVTNNMPAIPNMLHMNSLSTYGVKIPRWSNA